MTREVSWQGMVRDSATLLLLAIVLALASFWLNPKAPAWNWTRPTVQEVDLSEALSWSPAPLWIDARASDSYEKQHIPGAISLNETQWDQLLPVFLAAWQPDTKVVIYCDSQACDASRSVGVRLQRELKIDRIHVLKGGWVAWLERKHL